MRRRRKAQLGCLLMLLAFVLLGVAAEYLSPHDKPGDDEGGGPIGALTIIGLVAFFVLFTVAELSAKIRELWSRKR